MFCQTKVQHSERKCDDKESQDVISFSKYERLEAEYISACKTIEALKRQIVKQEMKDENNAAIQIEAKPEVNSYISAADSSDVADGPTASDKTLTKKKSKFSNKISTDIVIKEKEFEPNIENYDSADSLSQSLVPDPIFIPSACNSEFKNCDDTNFK